MIGVTDAIHPSIPAFHTPKTGGQYAKMYFEWADALVFRVIWVTPEWATEVLAKLNTRNRRRSPANTTKIRNIITRWGWKLNGEPIIFDQGGRLIDGQHRLAAVVESCIPVPICAVFGVHPDAFETGGQAKRRSGADVLSVPSDDKPDGEENASLLSSTLNWVYRWDRNKGDMSAFHMTLTNGEIRHFLNCHPGVRNSVTEVPGICTEGVHNPSVWSALHYIFGQADEAGRDDFFAKVVEGIGGGRDSHELLLVRWLKNRVGKGYTVARNVETLAVAIKTWNRVRAGDPVPASIVWRTNEPFPVVEKTSA